MLDVYLVRFDVFNERIPYFYAELRFWAYVF
jgi:hypothetical protein